MNKAIVMSVCIVAAFAAEYPRPAYPAYEKAYNYPPMPYSFNWAVKDERSYNDFGHQENSDGKVTTGSYRVVLPDGRRQVVDYKADYYGYTADVKYEGDAKAYNEYKPAYKPYPSYPAAYPAPAYPAPAYPTPVSAGYPRYSYPAAPAYYRPSAYPRPAPPAYPKIVVEEAQATEVPVEAKIETPVEEVTIEGPAVQEAKIAIPDEQASIEGPATQEPKVDTPFEDVMVEAPVEEAKIETLAEEVKADTPVAEITQTRPEVAVEDAKTEVPQAKNETPVEDVNTEAVAEVSTDVAPAEAPAVEVETKAEAEAVAAVESAFKRFGRRLF